MRSHNWISSEAVNSRFYIIFLHSKCDWHIKFNGLNFFFSFFHEKMSFNVRGSWIYCTNGIFFSGVSSYLQYVRTECSVRVCLRYPSLREPATQWKMISAFTPNIDFTISKKKKKKKNKNKQFLFLFHRRKIFCDVRWIEYIRIESISGKPAHWCNFQFEK